ncbi:endosome-associated-trafficking regulator 1-like isoform X2 [Ostrea edulis]|uniref:endosome-associated-trafficking regulator 1-like isoform X2 n=1 Tax=Ostrea edulis TaxID=37623 RepID=UPI0024AF6146|nr:endosome-associated-trafficking regulator 1-like isoform X2 [Ostrea edulis]
MKRCNESSKDSKKKKQDENPFSFKKFLESSGSGTKPRDRNGRAYHLQRTSQNTPDFATDLPDFVQDHFQDSPADSQLPPKLDFPLPDLGFPNESTQRGSSNSFNEQFSVRNDDSRNLSSDSLRAKGVFTPNNSASDLVSGIGEVNVNNIDVDDIMLNRPHVPTSLPDFITDGILRNADSSQTNDMFLPKPQDYQQKGPQTVKNGTNRAEERERLKTENESLKQQLEEAKNRTAIETNRCNKLNKEMEAAQKKEAEDTAAMEKMLEEVEANLLTTTKRAVAAENQLTVLQNRVTFLENENKLLKSGDKGLADLKEKTTYVSQQLATVVSTAEQNLKHMLSGVENLRVMSQVLKSIDKISDTEDDSCESSSRPKNNS